MADWRTFGSATYNWPGDMTAATLAPDRVSRFGGDTIRATGVFNPALTYQVRVDGVVAYSGVEGQAGVVVPLDGTALEFVMPRIVRERVGARVVEIQELPAGATVQADLAILERPFGNLMLDMRRMFPPWMGVGPRRLDLESSETV